MHSLLFPAGNHLSTPTLASRDRNTESPPPPRGPKRDLKLKVGVSVRHPHWVAISCGTQTLKTHPGYFFHLQEDGTTYREKRLISGRQCPLNCEWITEDKGNSHSDLRNSVSEEVVRLLLRSSTLP